MQSVYIARRRSRNDEARCARRPRVSWQFCYIEAENGAEAVEKFQEFKPDLVILDISMPKLDGFSAAREIRALNPDVPIIIFSLNRTELFSEIAERIGVSGYVTKSDGSQAFLSAVDAALSANSVPKT